MAQYKALNPKVEVNGRTILSVVDGMAGFESKAMTILSGKGISGVVPDGWYLQQAWLDAFKDIAREVGPKTLVAIGTKIPENADWPPEIKTIEDALASIDIAFHMNHRIEGKQMFDPGTGAMGEGIGHYRFSKTGPREATVECNNPYPCDFDKGIIKAVATRFKPPGAKLDLREHKAKGCRKEGGQACTYIVSW